MLAISSWGGRNGSRDACRAGFVGNGPLIAEPISLRQLLVILMMWEEDNNALAILMVSMMMMMMMQGE